MLYSIGIKNCAYKISGGTLSPLASAQKISFSNKSETRNFICRLSDGQVTSYNEVVDAGKDATLEIITLPLKFMKEVLGFTQAQNGVITENIRPKSVHFSLFYETQGDDEPIRVQLYDVVCPQPDFDVTTISNKLAVDGRKLKLIVNSSVYEDLSKPRSIGRSIRRSDNPTLFDNWFGEVTTT